MGTLDTAQFGGLRGAGGAADCLGGDYEMVGWLIPSFLGGDGVLLSQSRSEVGFCLAHVECVNSCSARK
jgi:hypothetical protein